MKRRRQAPPAPLPRCTRCDMGYSPARVRWCPWCLKEAAERAQDGETPEACLRREELESRGETIVE